jgi:hypothetical protein
MKDWLTLQKTLYNQVQRELKTITKTKSASFQKYEKDFHRDLQKEKPSSWNQFVKAQREAEVFLVGDFHSFRQSQKQLLRLLENKQLRSPKSLGLEVLSPELEPELQKLLKKKGKISWQALLEKIEIDQKWGSSVFIYEQIFQWAAQNEVKIFSLGCHEGSLKKRDREAALRIDQQEGPVWAFLGEFHCARPHLPSEIQKRRPNASVLSLQQNHDRLALKFLHQLETQSNLLFEISNQDSSLRLFCLIHTLPWVKWQGDLDFKRRQSEGSLDLDPQDQILWSLKTLGEFFSDPRYPATLKTEGIEDFTAMCTHDEAFVPSLKALPQLQRRFVFEELERKKVAVLFRQRRIFLSEQSLNSCSQAAAEWLICHWQSRQSFQMRFYENTLLECLRFFLSKILNHRRKGRNWSEWSLHLKAAGETKKLKALLESPHFYKREMNSKKEAEALAPFEKDAALALGRWIADYSFEAFLAGELSKQRVTRLASQRSDIDEVAYSRLVELLSLAKDFRY